MTMSTSGRKLTKSKSAMDVFSGSKSKMKKIQNLMGSLHNGHTKTTKHTELSSDSEDDVDQYGQSSSQGTNSVSSSNSDFEDGNLGIFLGNQGRRGSNEESDHESENGFRDDKAALLEPQSRTLYCGELEKEDNIVSPSPVSPICVIPLMMDPASEGGASVSGSPQPETVTPSAKVASGSPKAQVQTRRVLLKKAKSVGTLLVEKDWPLPSPQDSSGNSSMKKVRQSMRKSKSTRSIKVDHEIECDLSEEASAAKEIRSKRSSTKKSGSTRSLYSSKGGRISSQKNEQASLSLDSDDHRITAQGVGNVRSVRSMKPGDDEKRTPSMHKRSVPSIRKSRSMRSFNLSEEDLTAPSQKEGSSHSTSSRKMRGIPLVGKSRSVRSLKVSDDLEAKEFREDMESAKTDSSAAGNNESYKQKLRKTKSLDETGLPAPVGAITGRRASMQHSTPSPAIMNRRGSLQYSMATAAPATTGRRASMQHTTPSPAIPSKRGSPQPSTNSPEPATSTRRPSMQHTLSSSSHSKQKSGKESVTRTKSNVTKEEDDMNIRYNERRRSIAASDDDNFTLHITAARTATSVADHDDSRGLCRSMSLSKLVDENWQCRRNKSKPRDEPGNKKNEGEVSVFARKTKSRRRASMTCSEDSSPNDTSEVGPLEQDVGSQPLEQGVRGGKAYNICTDPEILLPAQPCASVRRRNSRSNRPTPTTKGEIRLGDTPQESSTDADTGDRVNCRPDIYRPRDQTRLAAENSKRKRSKSLRGLKDLRTKLGHSSGPMLSPKGCNQSITSGSISSLTMSSRLFTHDDHSFASSQISQKYATPRLFVAGELSSSLLIEGDEMAEDQQENRLSRWESLPQSNRQSLDVLPVAPDHDVSSYAGLMDISQGKTLSEGGRWSGGTCGRQTQADTVPVPPNHDTSSFCGLMAPDTPSQSVHSNMGLISELTPATFASRESSQKSPQQRKSSRSGNCNNRDYNSLMANLSNLLLEETDCRPQGEVSERNRKRDSTPRRVRRHSFDSFTSLSSPDQSGLAQPCGLSAALTQLDGEQDNAPKKPARRTSTGSSVQFVASDSRKGVRATVPIP